MDYLLIYAITLFAFGLLAVCLWTSSDNIYSIRNLFLGVWFYYGFSVGLDLLLGFEIPYKDSEADLNAVSLAPDILRVMIAYLTCGLAFLATCSFLGAHRSVPIDKKYKLRLPPAWALCALHVPVAMTYVSQFIMLSRMGRSAAVAGSVEAKLIGLLVPCVLVLDIIYVVCSDPKKGRIAAFLIFLFSIITGTRGYAAIACLAALFRWRVRLPAWKLASLGSGAVLFFLTFKTVYSVSLAWWNGIDVDSEMLLDNLRVSLAGMDALGSYLIAVFYLGGECPFLMGTTYTEIPFYLTWPRFLSTHEVHTLAETYMMDNHLHRGAAGGAMGFSAIAESWLNFGMYGPAILGVAWACLTKFFDGRPRGLAFYVFVFITFKLFRSDFGSLYKHWIVVWGFLFTFVFLMLKAYTIVANGRRPMLPTGQALTPQPAT